MTHTESVQSWLSALGDDTWDRPMIKASRVVSASKEEAIFAMTVKPLLCNALGTMHGGALATAIDLLTSAAIVPSSYDGFWQSAGVSRTLSVTYLRPAIIDREILFICRVTALGRRSGVITCQVVDALTKKVIAIGTHDKVSIDSPSRL